MTDQAQNALLLTLEEPPPFVVFLLLANEADALLETIRSRAPTLRLQPVGEAQLSAYLLSPTRGDTARVARALQEQGPAEYAALLRMANGCIGRALELLEEKTRAPQLARREGAKALCALLSQGGQPQALLELLRGFGASREELVGRLLFVNEALRDLVALCHSDNAPLIFYTDREQALELSARFTARELLGFVAATNDTLAALSANANTRLAMAQYLCRLTA